MEEYKYYVLICTNYVLIFIIIYVEVYVNLIYFVCFMNKWGEIGSR